MRLQRLELLGFKSFADRTLMDFGSHTLTGIVGPNGCGKSNVVDAVRWVLGETRPTSLRGSGMTDVIFKGSASRPPMSVAEVTLILTNDGVLEGRGSEVSITRRLFKSGEGEYLIDGQRVRRKDVRDMLFDTGLGSRGYSVLEQGRIDAVLSANPVERRKIFEEAAGISRYRQRRHEAELRLGRVEQDATRLEDVMRELRTRVRSLKIQAGKAERYVIARTEWTEQRSRLAKQQLFDLTRELAELTPLLARLEEDLEGMRARRTECEQTVTLQEDERASVVAELERVSSDAARVAGEIRALDERKTQLALRVASWEASAGEESERAEVLGAELVERRAELESITAQREELEHAFEAARGAADGLVERLRDLTERYREARQAAEEQNETVLARLHEKTAAQNRQRHLEESRGPAEERLARAEAKRSSAEGVLGQLRDDRGAAESRTQACKQELARCEGRGQELERSQREVEADHEAARERSRSLELERARIAARVEGLLDREAELGDLSAGTRRVVEALEETRQVEESGFASNPNIPAGVEGVIPDDANKLPFASDEILGLVADHLLTDVEHARALDSSLGERSLALVARDGTSARSVAGWLRDKEEGLVAVVVPATLASLRDLGGYDSDLLEPEQARAASTGAPGTPLLAVVRVTAGLEPLADALLGDVRLVRDLDAALDGVAADPRWRYVTPGGELVDRAGLVGGQREVAQGAIGRRAEAAQLEEQANDLTRELDKVTAELTELEARREALRSSLDEHRLDLEARRGDLSQASGDLRAVEGRLADLTTSFEVAQREHAQVAEEIALLESQLASAAEERASSEQEFELQNTRLGEYEKGRHLMEEERELLARDESTAQVEVARVAGELRSAQERVEALELRTRELESEIDRSRERKTTFSQNASDGRVETETLGVDAAKLLEERGGLEEQLDELREFEKTGRTRMEELRKVAESVQRELDGAGDQLSQSRLTQQRLELAVEDVLTRAREDLGLNRSDLEQGFEPEEELASEEAMAALDQRVSELKAQLDKLGPVNTDAVDELEEVSERLDFLESQGGDLAKAQKTLRETIARIDQESERLFLETFEEVRDNFQGIFRKLFGGGRAEVRLLDMDNVLESGVEIVARPPGRELLPIALLSGGQRSMTALALLFAVFEARPSPFCVLDEVDAALDDANVDRFLGMLEGYRKTSQFILVTHNKASMSAAQALYGVTMEVKGVSRFVAVELDDVDAFTEAEPGAVVAGAGPSSPAGAPEKERIVELTPQAPPEQAEAPRAEGGVDEASVAEQGSAAGG